LVEVCINEGDTSKKRLTFEGGNFLQSQLLDDRGQLVRLYIYVLCVLQI